MLDFLASDWNELIRNLERLSSELPEMDFVSAVMEGKREIVTVPLRKIADSCALLGLRFSARQAERIIEMVETRPSLLDHLSNITAEDKKNLPESLDPKEVIEQVSILKTRIDDELSNRRFLAILPERTQYFRQPELFGTKVWKNFPSARYDIEEAGTCYACDRIMACAFHLMRAMEIGLRVLATSLGNPSVNANLHPSWELILRPCDEELKKPIAQRSAVWRQNESFFADATANLRAVKVAWRNPTLHVEANYDEEKVYEILNAVKVFMRHLATNLSEVPSR